MKNCWYILGLFSRAISQSGVAFVSWGLRDKPVEQAKYFAKLVNCPNDTDVQEIAKCLKEMDVVKLGRAHMDAAVNNTKMIVLF
jgi:carboxylesterase type B